MLRGVTTRLRLGGKIASVTLSPTAAVAPSAPGELARLAGRERISTAYRRRSFPHGDETELEQASREKARRAKKSAANPGRAKQYVYFFGNGHADGNRGMKDLLGGKGAGLAEMTNAGLPVPPGFTISTEVCGLYYREKGKIPSDIDREIERQLAKLEQAAGAQLGSSDNPLLVSVRSGAKFSMPGMMDTILNLGLNDDAVEGLKRRTQNGRFAFDSYRRFIQMFGNVVLEIPKDAFEHEFAAVKQAKGVTLDTELDEAALREVVGRYKQVVKKRSGRDFPQQPNDQLKMSRDAVFRSWMNPRAQEYRRIYDIPDDIGTAVNVQMMVFGNTGDRSGTGVGFTRNPATGTKEFYGEFLINAQGEDVVAGIRTPQPIRELEAGDAEGLQAAARHHQPAREALQGRPGLRVHHPGRAAVHAADPERQAHRLRRGGDRHRPGRRAAHLPEGGGSSRRSRVAQPAARARVRSRTNGRRSRPPPGACRHRPARPAARSCSRPNARSNGPSRANRSSWFGARRCRTTFTACSCRRAS